MADERNQGYKDSFVTYVVQCHECEKWREIPTKQEFKAIRERGEEVPWFCGRDPGGGRSCEQPEDVPYDRNYNWAMDMSGIPRAPPGTERILVMRRDLSKVDTYYLMPNGKHARSVPDVKRFLEENPEYRATLQVSNFSFSTPKIIRGTVEDCSRWRASKAYKREIYEESSVCRAAKVNQREIYEDRSKEISLCRDAKAESERSEETDASDSDYRCPSSSGASE